ncbi:MAG: choice-of-anchor D domain-containing protein [Myxococcales bacterium]|nr:choice-of-anchor D domain-containing protein [Myxococcales bacterium]
MTTKSVALLVLSAAAFAACDGCNSRRPGLQSSVGELALVWQGPDFARMVDRDAKYDFGYALVGETRQAVVVAKNVGTGPLTLTALARLEGDEVSIAPLLQPTAPFAAEFTSRTLTASEEASYVVTFSPRGGRSAYFTKLRLYADGALETASTADITLVAKGDLGSCDLPRVIDLGNVPVGDTFASAFKFKNATMQDTEATIGGFEGGDAAAFGFGENTAAGKVLVAANGETTVFFTVSPTEQRAYETTIQLAGAGPSCEPVTVVVKANGVEDVLSWTPMNLRFGLVSPGFEREMQVVFTNTATGPVELTNITVSSPQDFSHVVAPGADDTRLTIPGGGMPVSMKVTCSPAMLGNRSGTLSFDTGLRKTPRGSIQLDCTGGGPKIRVSPRPNIAFGHVPFFQGNPVPATRRISVQNVGVAPANPDPSFNLLLGKIDMAGMPGQAPMFELRPTGTDTQPGEFTLSLASSYDSRMGLRPVAGQNEVTLQVSLLPRTSGQKTADIIIHSNDTAEPDVTLTVTADVQILPPCNYRISPQLANFGIVPAGTTKDLPVTITNLGTGRGDSCFLSNFAIAMGSDPAYAFVGTPPVEKELRAQESWQLVIRVAPRGPAPATLTSLAGVVTFDVTNPQNPQGRIDLRTSVGPSCITATPDPLDFGTVKTVPPPGMRCSSPNKTITVYNTCSSPITIRGVSMSAAAGQTAGGPACAGGQPCPEFFLVQSPMIPAAGLTLSQGSMPVTLQVRYSPIDLGSDSGAIALDVTQSGQQVQYLVAIQGRGDVGGRQTDTFQQDQQPRADILLVVDDSCSMYDKQTSLANNFTSFIQYAVTANVDYQIGVVTTDVGQNGVLRTTTAGGKFLANTTPSVQTHFASLVRVGTLGSGSEQALESATRALTSPNIAGANVGFVRNDANLAIVVVSDAGDQSNQPVSYYENLLINVKGFSRLSNFTFSTIGPFLPTAPSGCSYDSPAGATRYQSLITRTGGVREEICSTNWSAALQGLGRTAFGFRTQFFLTNTPDLTGGGSINVLINGTPAPPSTYSYDAASNSIRFQPNTTPQPGQTLTVDYATTCF